MTDDEPDCTRKGAKWVSFILKPYRRVKKIKKVRIK